MDDFAFPLRGYMPDNDPGLPAQGSVANPPAKSRAGRIKRINELLAHPACAGMRREVKQLLCNPIKNAGLRKITSMLEAKAKKAPPVGPAGSPST